MSKKDTILINSKVSCTRQSSVVDTTPTNETNETNERTRRTNNFRRVENSTPQNKKFKIAAGEILDAMNQQFKRRFEPCESNLKPIISFFKAGYDQNDAWRIILCKSRDPFFKKNRRLFCPQTLFRKSHWGKYLEESATTRESPL